MATTTEKLITGTQATIFTGTSSLANNALIASGSSYNNIQACGGGYGYTRARLTLNATFSVTPTVPSAMNVWFLTSEDGTTFEAGSSSVVPSRAPDCVIPFIASTSATQYVGDAALPVGLMNVLVQNAASAQTVSSGWTLKLLPYTRQSV
jgi:hypothetical protein